MTQVPRLNRAFQHSPKSWQHQFRYQFYESILTYLTRLDELWIHYPYSFDKSWHSFKARTTISKCMLMSLKSVADSRTKRSNDIRQDPPSRGNITKSKEKATRHLHNRWIGCVFRPTEGSIKKRNLPCSIPQVLSACFVRRNPEALIWICLAFEGGSWGAKTLPGCFRVWFWLKWRRRTWSFWRCCQGVVGRLSLHRIQWPMRTCCDFLDPPSLGRDRWNPGKGQSAIDEVGSVHAFSCSCPEGHSLLSGWSFWWIEEVRRGPKLECVT